MIKKVFSFLVAKKENLYFSVSKNCEYQFQNQSYYVDTVRNSYKYSESSIYARLMQIGNQMHSPV